LIHRLASTVQRQGGQSSAFLSQFPARLKQLAEKVGLATEAFAAAKAGRLFCSLFGMAKAMPCYKAFRHAIHQTLPKALFVVGRLRHD
jgi:hypothetical protein